MRKQLYYWQLQLDRKNLRERIVIFLLIWVVIYVIWDLLLCSPAKQSLIATEKQITVYKQQVRGFSDNSSRIEAAAALADNQKLVQHYQQLQQQLINIDHKIKTYKFHTVSLEQMSTMLQSVLREVPGITLNEFKTTATAPPPQPTTTAGKKSANANNDPLKPLAKSYQLEITGNYFGLQAYLERLEHLDWQIYWDEFNYNVTKRPVAKIVLRFHTLSFGVQDAK